MGMKDGGFTVEFNGKKNIVLRDGVVKEYPIGGMACEYARLKPHEIKEILMRYDGLEDKFELKALDRFLNWFNQESMERFGLVIAGLMFCDFINIIHDMYKRNDDQLKEYFNSLNEQGLDSIKDFIFKDTKWSDFGKESVGQAVLTAYFDFSTYYAVSRTTFDILAEDGNGDEDEDRVDGFLSMFSTNMDVQHIDFHLVDYEGRINFLYTFNSAASLILFEAANIMNNDIKLVKCPNCGHYFVPEGRSDTLYCSYPSPQNHEKTCQEVGAQAARSNKEKNDVGTREYRKKYMKMKMAANRHPGEKKYYQPLEELTEGNKEWRKKLKDGSASMEDYLAWISSF